VKTLYSKYYIWLIVTIALFLVCITGDVYFLKNPSINSHDSLTIQNKFLQLEKKVEKELNKVSSIINEKGINYFLAKETANWENNLKKQDLIITINDNNKLLYWSDNSFIDNRIINNIEPSVFFYNNSWVYCVAENINNYTINIYAILKRDYNISNKYLKTEINKILNLPELSEISNLPSPEGFNIKNKNNEFIFSINLINSINEYKSSLFFIIIYLLFYISLFVLIWKIFNHIPQNKKQLGLIFLILFFIIFRIISIYFKLPNFIYNLEPFSPVYYAASFILPSLGDLFINSVLFFIIVIIFYRRTGILVINTKLKQFLSLLLFFVFAYLISWIFRTLIYHSGFSMALFNLQEINFFLIISLIILTIFIGAIVLFLDRILLSFYKYNKNIKDLVIYGFISLLITYIFHYLIFNELELLFTVFIVAIFTIFCVFYYSVKFKQITNIFVLALLVSALISGELISHYGQKNRNVKKAIISGLSYERDLLAEMLIEELQRKIYDDIILSELLKKPYENQERTFNYLKNNYFFGYWSKYDLHTTVCGPWDNLRIEQTNKIIPCKRYFDDLIKEYGSNVNNTDFFFMHNNDGRISYLGDINLRKSSDSIQNKLYIELNSRNLSHTLGYPDLLIDKRIIRSKKLDQYSYAFYKNGVLTSSHGDYLYSFINKSFSDTKKEYEFKNYNGYEHLIYKASNNTVIVLSSKTITLMNYLTGTAYLFAILSLAYLIILIIEKNPLRLKFSELTIKQRLRFAFLGVFLLSLIMIGGGTIYYMIKTYKNKNLEFISEKLQSVLIELEHKIGNEPKITSNDYEYINSLLVKFSNVFFSDINLFDKEGVLIATSRADVFSKGISGNLMNQEAYRKLSTNRLPKLIHNENIGSLEYISAYVPFYNYKGKLLAYLNLPYFTKQNDLTYEISNFIVTIVNIYLLLFIIGIWLTLWLSRSLTYPLAMLQTKFKKVGYGKSNERIIYNRNDEIGDLVKQYNHMLDELAISANKLAESERESAWREMAKQIAHEIKNPLTPMKLSLQHLQKAYSEKSPGWEDLIDKVSKTIIEQIDSLSIISSEFSAFARMPQPSTGKVNIIERISSLIPLYSQITNISIKFNSNDEDEVWVKGDKEHIIRMFNNLIKNSIQAIPKDREGIINIEVKAYPQIVIIKISDNGTGIPDSIKDKLYMPNFTTKSSGMGLGLAIVKRIIESMNGEIKFISGLEQGTTFFIEIPRYK